MADENQTPNDAAQENVITLPSLEDQCKALQALTGRLMAEATKKNQRIGALEAKDTASQTALEALNERLRAMQKELDAINAQNTGLLGQVAERDTTIATMQKGNSALAAQVAQEQEKNNKLNDKLKVQMEDNARLRTENKGLQDKNQQDERDLAQLTSNIKGLNAKLAASQKEGEEKDTKIAAQQAVNDQLNEGKVALEGENKNLKGQLVTAQGELTQTRTGAQKYCEQVEQRAQQLVEEANNRAQAAEGRANTLQQQIAGQTQQQKGSKKASLKKEDDGTKWDTFKYYLSAATVPVQLLAAVSAASVCARYLHTPNYQELISSIPVLSTIVMGASKFVHSVMPLLDICNPGGDVFKAGAGLIAQVSSGILSYNATEKAFTNIKEKKIVSFALASMFAISAYYAYDNYTNSPQAPAAAKQTTTGISTTQTPPAESTLFKNGYTCNIIDNPAQKIVLGEGKDAIELKIGDEIVIQNHINYKGWPFYQVAKPNLPNNFGYASATKFPDTCKPK